MDYDVAIVGAGPVGLMLGAELGAYGVSVCILEKDSVRSPTHPKANNQSARSMEYYRRQGIASALFATGMPEAYPCDATYFTTFAKHEIARINLPSKQQALADCLAGDPVWQSAEPQIRTSQRSLTPLLLEKAESYSSVTVMDEAEVTRLADDGAGASLLINSHKGPEILRASFCVGCDGARSFVRRELGIRFAGEGGLDMEFMGGRMVACYFRSPDLMAVTGVRPSWQYWAILPDLRAVMVTLDGREEFILHRQLPKDVAPENYDIARDLERLCGKPVSAEIISSATWRAGQALVAPEFGKGRIFLAGDSAHIFTPTGGMGLNTGIEDAVNLAWKLAAAVKGEAGPYLLATYTDERRAIALRNTGYALKLARAVGECPVAACIADDSAEGAAARDAAKRHIMTFARNEFEHPGIGLGTRYDHSPIIIPDGAEPPADDPIEYHASTVPGGRLPHVWLEAGLSLLDLAGHGFTLIDLDSEASGLSLDASWLDLHGLRFHSLSRPDLAAQLDARLLLVRPDQIIAWRIAAECAVSETDIEDVLRIARGHLETDVKEVKAS